MDLHDLFKEIPDGRELRLSRRPEGMIVHVADYKTAAHARKLIPCADIAHHAGDFEQFFINRLRLVNAMLDREIEDPNHG